MQGTTLDTPGDPVAGATRDALAVLLLTSVHHAYGAFVYHTPWRLHVVPVSIAVAAVILAARRRLRHDDSSATQDGARGPAWWVFVLTTLAFPVLTIGVVEGLYNHLAKDLLYYGGASISVMTRLFPPPTYEMPNDAFFEITGVLQAVPALLAARHLHRMFGAGSRRARYAIGD